MPRFFAAAAGILLLAAPASALPITFSGSLDDPGNTALVASNLGAPLFGNIFDVANNVAIYDLVISAAEEGNVTFESVGYGLGGIEPYLTIFDGAGGSAVFLDSNFFIPAIDFTLTRFLAAGTYRIAIGSWLNMSFAENFGVGTFAAGFTGLGGPSAGSSYYEIRVTGDRTPTAVPEPATVLLVTAGLGTLARRLRAKTARG